MDDPMDADFDTLIPLEFIILQLPPFQISELVQRQICELPDPLADCIFPLTYWQALQTHPITPMFLSYNGKVAALTWLTEPLLLHKPMLARYWYREDVMGFIRNQFEHLLCWSFVATDMVSAMSVIHGWEDDYRVFCPWYLFLCCNPTSVGRDVDAKPGHKCYAFSVTQALRFIQASGVPKVGVGRSKSDFDCSELYPLPPFGEASRISQRVSGVRPIETLEEAILELRFRPVACDLVCYSQLAKDAEIYGFKVYTGPFNQRSGMIGYHAVIMVDVTLVDGRWVAICKMCNGVDAAVQGYVYVCLSTMYTFVGCIDESRRFIRPSSRPQRLLTNFVVLEMHENQKGEKKQDEKKPDERDPENPKERKLKEPCSVAGMNQYKTISLERADPKTEPSKLTRACNTQKHIDLDDVGKQMKDELDVFPEEAVIPEAKCIKGLRAVSGEVYPDPVRMVSIGRKVEKDLLADPEDSEGSLLLSSEFCGGTDITNTRKAKASALLLEERIAKRIRNDAFKVEDECAFDVTAECALDALNVAASLEKEVDDASKVEGSALEKKVAALKRRVDMAIIPAAKKADIRAKITLLQALKKESG